MSNFRYIYWPRVFFWEGMKNSCCLSSKLSMHQSHCLAPVYIRQNGVCCLDTPETKRWVDGLWPLWAFHLQELRRRALFNKAAKRSHVRRQAAKQLGDGRGRPRCSGRWAGTSLASLSISEEGVAHSQPASIKTRSFLVINRITGRPHSLFLTSVLLDFTDSEFSQQQVWIHPTSLREQPPQSSWTLKPVLC